MADSRVDDALEIVAGLCLAVILVFMWIGAVLLAIYVHWLLGLLAMLLLTVVSIPVYITLKEKILEHRRTYWRRRT